MTAGTGFFSNVLNQGCYWIPRSSQPSNLQAQIHCTTGSDTFLEVQRLQGNTFIFHTLLKEIRTAELYTTSGFKKSQIVFWGHKNILAGLRVGSTCCKGSVWWTPWGAKALQGALKFFAVSLVYIYLTGKMLQYYMNIRAWIKNCWGQLSQNWLCLVAGPQNV